MISDVYFPRINGVSTSIQTFRRDLEALDHEVTLIAPRYPQSAAVDEPGILRVPSLQVPRDPEDRMMLRGRIRGLLPNLRTRRYDLVHVQTPFIAHYAGRELARALDLPVLETYHTYFEEYLHHYVPLMPRRLMRFLARRFTCWQCNEMDHLIAPSRAMRDALVEYAVRTPITIIPTGLEADRFEPADGRNFRQRFGIDPNRPVIVHVGRIAHEKNIDFLLRVMARLVEEIPHALLLVAGEGPALEHCKELAHELGLEKNTLFVGYLDRKKELLECYRAGDVFVFASRTETQGLVLLEAMAQGVPVVSTAHMGTLDILDAGRGCMVVEESEPLFAEAVRELLLDPAKRTRLGDDARAYAATWSAREMALRLVELYGAITAGRASPALAAEHHG